MKKCLLCGDLDEGDAMTCPNDGEASWEELARPAAASDAPADDAPAEEPKKPRGRK